MPELFCAGYGYSAAALASRLLPQGWRVSGTARDPAKRAAMASLGVEAQDPGQAMAAALARATHLVVSVPPGEQGDPILNMLRDWPAPQLAWIGYLSTTGVYGDHGGAWVTEASELRPLSPRSRRRAAAEGEWAGWARERGVPVQIFRLAGIYGPGRSQLDGLRDGTARRIVKPGQVFSRIHVGDIANVLERAIENPSVDGAFNVCDDLPAPPADVTAYAAELLGIAPPPLEDFDAARATMSEMALSFWADSKRVANDRMKAHLGVKLLYPTFREGLAAILRAEGDRS
jgi:nucleoside-diphosphate-sugar epimerase